VDIQHVDDWWSVAGLANLTSLQTFIIANSYFTGPIPESLYALGGTLETIDLSYNSLSGSLPSFLCDMVKLEEVYLVFNLFSGQIECIGDATIQFVVYNNVLSGTLSSSTLNASKLEQFDVANNYLNGSIHLVGGNVNSLQVLGLNGNFFYGQLQDTIGAYSSLYELDIGNNSIEGSIPTSIGLLQDLTMLAINNNRFSGTIVSEIGDCSKLRFLYLGTNSLTGTLPPQLGSLRWLAYLAVNNNMLHSTVPPTYANLSYLVSLQLSNNYFSGPNPLQLAGHFLTYLGADSNLFTSSIPGNWTGFYNLTYVLLDYNYISNSIPSSIGVFNFTCHQLNCDDDSPVSKFIPEGVQVSMIEFSASSNCLSGPIPGSIVTHTALRQVSLSSNMLTGRLTADINLLHSLQTLNVSNNDMSGPLPLQYSNNLIIFSVSYNSFTGNIPEAPFMAPNISVIDLSTNCFSGSFPSTICSAQTLSSLLMNALSSGEGCRFDFAVWSWLFHGIISTRALSASLPSCIFELPHLVTLQLAGNAMVGSLPNIALPVNLTNIQLGSNLLEGTIPLHIQTSGNISSLGLQRNRLSGTLSSEFVAYNTSSMYVRMQVNRLSGKLPTAFNVLSQIDVLSGNLFSCSSSGELPQADPNTATYNCGSNNFNVSVFIWISLAGSLALLVGLLYTAGQHRWKGFCALKDGTTSLFIKRVALLSAETLKWFQTMVDVGKDRLFHTYEFLLFLRRTTVSVVVLTTIYVSICMVTYIGMKAGHSTASFSLSTTTKQYAWITTTAYMHGAAPVVLIFCYLSASFGYIGCRVRSKRYRFSQTVSRRHDGYMTVVVSLGRHGLLPVGVQCVNFAVALCVNGMYLRLVEFEHISPVQRIAAELMLTAFKLLWTATYIPFSMSLLTQHSSGHKMWHYVFMLCMLLIIAPIAASAAGSQSCFYNLFVPAPSIDSSYTSTTLSTECFAQVVDKFVNGKQVPHFAVGCLARTLPSTVSSSSDPPFIYSYQCGSTLLSNYIPVFMYSYIFSGLIVPICRIVLINCSKPFLARILPIFVYNFVVLNSLLDCEAAEKSTTASVLHAQHRISEETKVGNTHSNNEVSKDLYVPNTSKSLFDGPNIVAKRLLDLAVIFTFGLACPILALAVAIGVFTNAAAWRIAIGKFVSSRMHLPDDEGGRALLLLEESCRGLLSGCKAALWVVIVVSCMFWSLMLFDMTADVYGFTSGMTAVYCVLFGLPVLEILIFRVCDVENAPSFSVREYVNRCSAQIRICCGLNAQKMSSQPFLDSLNEQFEL
jgi:Leucine-rich repeat (LRR) protein